MNGFVLVEEICLCRILNVLFIQLEQLTIPARDISKHLPCKGITHNRFNLWMFDTYSTGIRGKRLCCRVLNYCTTLHVQKARLCIQILSKRQKFQSVNLFDPHNAMGYVRSVYLYILFCLFAALHSRRILSHCN